MALTINTNLTSLMVQLNLEKSTVNLNTSLERLTTGYRINSAKDDAAGMSASIDFDTKISATQVARDNVNLATSMFNTASETLELMSKHLVRARDLCVQSANGVYSKDSVNAIKQELQQLVDELYRTKNTTEFNGISLFGEKEGVTGSAGLETDISPVHNGFIAEVVEQTPDVIVTKASDLEDAIANNTVIGVANADVLAELATIVNNGNDCSGKTIVLTEDIDLAGREWTPIGIEYSNKSFAGNFNGNGHVISNLKITNYTQNYCGLFGFSNGDISNVGVENVDISSNNNYSVGGLVGRFAGSSITNCYATGDVKGTGNSVGGLIGDNAGDITNCYATGNVTGGANVGGLVGNTLGSFDLINCYATGDVTGTGVNVGGLVGQLSVNPGDIISNCYATGNVKGSDRVGGLFGLLVSVYDSLTNCYATGDVVGDNYVGGLFGRVDLATCTNCYASGDVTGIANVGGISGDGGAFGLSDSYFAGGVSGADVTTTGIIAGKVGSSSFFTNCKYDGSKQNGMALYNDPSGTVTTADLTDMSTNLQVGIDGTAGSRIKASAIFSLGGLESIINAPEDDSSIKVIDKILARVTSVQTNLGALLNRLDSVGESLDVSERTMTSANSVIKDADMAKESSAYLRSQILQQASAALLTSANQLPSMTLALIQGIR